MKQKKVSIGGQAVLEGVMMRGEKSMAIAVRDADGIIRVETKRTKPMKCRKIPIIRGFVSFFQSLFGGTAVLMRSADVYGEGEPSKFEKWLAEKLKVNVMAVVGTVAIMLALVLAIALFMIAPQAIRTWILGDNPNVWAKNFLEGGLKLLIFVLYIFFCSLIKDVKRTFMYHGAEHKTISCFEKGFELTPDNAKKCSRVHNRCGTTFIFFVMIISIILFAVFESILQANGIVLNKIVRVLCKIALLPLVAGLSYELLKALAKTDSWIVYPLKVPGLLLQRLTTKEPDEKMLEVAIASFNAVLEMDKDETVPERKFIVPEKRKELVERVYKELLNNGIEERAEAEWIVSIVANVKRDELNSDKLVSARFVEKINEIVKSRITGRPLWYCIGDTEFFGYKIKVDESVLIPRPETELLVENGLKLINGESEVLDLCTGSGAIAIAINKESKAKVVASDISLDALNKAKENAKINNAEVEFIESDLFDNLGNRKFDVIISNPPYIKSEDIKSLQSEVRDYEPKLALDGGKDGFDFYRLIAKNCKKYLKEKGVLLLEVGINQAEEVKNMLSGFSEIEIIKDYENIDRIVKAVL
ncbi:MAG: peptide chain release factor N(5)-glutamine methyltransferase [Clostridia bacterium]|nr:peptide chain release factor N(5)-glutamine methyltransferase [Clostridia bacterium]